MMMDKNNSPMAQKKELFVHCDTNEETTIDRDISDKMDGTTIGSAGPASPMIRSPLMDVKNKKMNQNQEASQWRMSSSKMKAIDFERQTSLAPDTYDDISSPSFTKNQLEIVAAVADEIREVTPANEKTYSPRTSPTKSVLQRRRVDAARDMAMVNFETRCIELQRELEEARKTATESMEMNAMLTWRLAEIEVTLSDQHKDTELSSPSCARTKAQDEEVVSSGNDDKCNTSDDIESCDSRSCGNSTDSGSPIQINDFFTRYDASNATPRQTMYPSPRWRTDEETNVVAELTSKLWIAEAKAELLSERLNEYTTTTTTTTIKPGDAMSESSEDRQLKDCATQIEKVDRDAILRENESLISELERTAIAQHTMESYKAEVQTKTEMIEKLQAELAQSRAENYELACKHKAGLSRLQNVIEGDGKLRQQLAAQAALISRLESQRREISGVTDIERQYHDKYQTLVENNGNIRASIGSQIDLLTQENIELRNAVMRQQESIEMLSSRGQDILYLLEAVQNEDEQIARMHSCCLEHQSLANDTAQIFRREEKNDEDDDFTTLKLSYDAKWKAAEAERRSHISRISELETQVNDLRNQLRQCEEDDAQTQKCLSDSNHDKSEFEIATWKLLSSCVKNQCLRTFAPSKLCEHQFSEHNCGSRPLSWKLGMIMSAKSRVEEIAEYCRGLFEQSTLQQDTIKMQAQSVSTLEQQIEDKHKNEESLKLEIKNRSQSESVIKGELNKASHALSMLDEDTQKLRHKLSKLNSDREADTATLKTLKAKTSALERQNCNLVKELDDAWGRERIALRKAEQYLATSKDGEEIRKQLTNLQKDASIKLKELETATKELQELQFARQQDKEIMSNDSKRVVHLQEVSRNQVKEIGHLKSELRRLKEESDMSTTHLQKIKEDARLERENYEQKIEDTKNSLHCAERAGKTSDEALKLSAARIESQNECIKNIRESLSTTEKVKAETLTKLASVQHELKNAFEVIGEMERVRKGNCEAIERNTLQVEDLRNQLEVRENEIVSLREELYISCSAKKDAEEKIASLQTRCDSMAVLETAIQVLKQSSATEHTNISELCTAEATSRGNPIAVDAIKENLLSLLSNNTSLVKEISGRLTANLLEKPTSVQRLESRAFDIVSYPALSDTSVACDSQRREDYNGSDNSTRAHSATSAHSSSIRKLIMKARYYRDKCKLLEHRLNSQGGGDGN